MPAPISREYRIYLALWRKAFTSTEPVTVKCPNTNLAIAMRQGMYRAISPFRSGKDTSDEVLIKACEKFVVYLVKGDVPSAPAFLEFRERKTLAALEEMDWAELGIGEEDLLIGEERTTYEGMKKLLPSNVELPKPATPFYKREE